jgi:AmmeMemoRadiSam system protein A
MSGYSEKEKNEMLRLARETIRLGLGGKKLPQTGMEFPALEERRGVFVTLHRNGELRGCIGYPLPVKPLGEAVVEMAKAAAFEDPRFPPLEVGELEEIDIEISVLTVPEAVKDPQQVEVGRDGIIISKGWNRGLLLPQVPVEQGWNRDQFLSHGCLKAGLPSDEWRRSVQIETFQAEVFGEGIAKEGS